ncbi:Decapping nuclease RAI1 [Grifola frondosa]|uniref:Decapping nuclease n=1 Tax=Grifola frondosa TaxID=5627 RepID=A0A1C7M633_GRIFR|nr:Decapping nuclease RAI1 [Grifola frondosa]
MEVNGTLYLEEHLSDAKLVEKKYDTASSSAVILWICVRIMVHFHASRYPRTAGGASARMGGDVDTNVQWCTVIKTKLGDTRMVIGGEVDCVRDKFTGQTDNLVELKTSMSIRGPQDEARFEKKLLKFYFQSFLLGVPEIVVGFRTPAGQITTIQSFKTIEMPRLVRGKPGAWDPQICLGWGHQFLAFLKSLIRPDGGDEIRMTPNVWRLRFTPRVGVSAWLLDNAGVREVEAGEERIGFLPKWYWDGLAKDPPASKPASEQQEQQDDAPVKQETQLAEDAGLPQGWQI